MRLLIGSVAAGILLVTSLSLKAMTPVDAHDSGMHQNDKVVIEALKDFGFSARSERGWILGVRNGCQLSITDVEPLGWTQSSVRRAADEGKIFYSYSGKLYDQQPILQTTVAYYNRRLMAYFHIERKLMLARAIVLDRACPPSAGNEVALLAARI